MDYNLSLSRDGRRLAYRAVEARTMGDVVVLDVASGARKTLTNVNPQLAELALGRLEPVSSAYDESNIPAIHLPIPQALGQCLRRTCLPALVEHDPVAVLRQGRPHALSFGRGDALDVRRGRPAFRFHLYER